MPAPPRRRIAVVGAGWAGLAAAMAACDAGVDVTVCEMAPHAGGRARQQHGSAGGRDNGQHILIGAYTRSLALLAQLGVDAGAAFVRTPLALRYPDGSGIALGKGPPGLAFAWAILTRRGWRWRDRVALLARAGAWQLKGYRCPADWSVAELCRGLPASVHADLIGPLCVAALNTAAHEACAQTFLRVLHDALDGRGASDLMLPRAGLSALLPTPATRWLLAHGASVRLRYRVATVAADGPLWRVDGEAFDGVVLATSATEAARLVRPFAPGWADRAEALDWEPIVTVWVRASGVVLREPMLMLHSDDMRRPAQFVFDHGQLTADPGMLAFVVSGARHWVEQGREAVAAAVLEQGAAEGLWRVGVRVDVLQVVSERRATFRCTPGLARPPAVIAPGLVAAGDHVAGPYPATLEGAVRSGASAVAALGFEAVT